MKKRRAAPALTRVNATVEAVSFKSPVRLVTLNDPADGAPEAARNAFVRLKPPPDQPSHETSAWRDHVAGIALAVRVSPTPRSALVPGDHAARGGDPVETVREAALAIAEEAGDPPLVELVEKVLSEVEGA